MRVKAMSPSFVRYTPDIEAADPEFDENLQIVIGRTEQYISQSVTTEGTGRAVRDAHARGYGLVRGEVEILDQLSAEYAQGIYAIPGKHDALMLFERFLVMRCASLLTVCVKEIICRIGHERLLTEVVH
jgi:hypothetical protein